MNLRFLPSRGRKDALLFALMLAMWLASALGLVHRTMHGSGSAPADRFAIAALPLHAQQAGDANPGASHGGLADLFGHHQDADCRLYDQLSHGAGTPCLPTLALPLILPATLVAYLEGLAQARWAALFDARGPPATR